MPGNGTPLVRTASIADPVDHYPWWSLEPDPRRCPRPEPQRSCGPAPRRQPCPALRRRRRLGERGRELERVAAWSPRTPPAGCSLANPERRTGVEAVLDQTFLYLRMRYAPTFAISPELQVTRLRAMAYEPGAAILKRWPYIRLGADRLQGGRAAGVAGGDVAARCPGGVRTRGPSCRRRGRQPPRWIVDGTVTAIARRDAADAATACALSRRGRQRQPGAGAGGG